MADKIQKLILQRLKEKGKVRAAEIIKATGFSRTYIHRAFQDLQRQGKLMLIGKANQARYILPTKQALRRARRQNLRFRRILLNQDLSEDQVLKEIKSDTGIFDNLPENVIRIGDYAFTEILNNAIEHSRSNDILIDVRCTEEGIAFRVTDEGVGIFKNIMQTRRLENELAAIQDLLKGKQTTDPARHTGEGIFFTSKAVDWLSIRGSNKVLIFDNRLQDIFIRNVKLIDGTDVNFWVSKKSKNDLKTVFDKYAGDTYEFDKTLVRVKLFKPQQGYVSRSEARRILSGLDSFTMITLDFDGVETIGQAFADEVFRLWKANHAHVKIDVANANENVLLMIQHVQGM